MSRLINSTELLQSVTVLETRRRYKYNVVAKKLIIDLPKAVCLGDDTANVSRSEAQPEMTETGNDRNRKWPKLNSRLKLKRAQFPPKIETELVAKWTNIGAMLR